jgi:hypothetical protein
MAEKYRWVPRRSDTEAESRAQRPNQNNRPIRTFKSNTANFVQSHQFSLNRDASRDTSTNFSRKRKPQNRRKWNKSDAPCSKIVETEQETKESSHSQPFHENERFSETKLLISVKEQTFTLPPDEKTAHSITTPSDLDTSHLFDLDTSQRQTANQNNVNTQNNNNNSSFSNVDIGSSLIREGPQPNKKTEKQSDIPFFSRGFSQTANLSSGRSHKENLQKEHNEYSQLSSKIIKELFNNVYDCAICSDIIKRHVATWSCSQCWKIFHIYCIKKWRSKSADQTSVNSFRCPVCRTEQTQEPEYRCFCGKVKDPPYDPYIIPHSCGEICGKLRLGTNCPHPCNLLCHPGPCPPCSAMSPIKRCFCGRTEYRTRCSDIDQGRSCGEVCGRMLNCGRHFCRERCHAGNCNRCDQKMEQKCYCGKTIEIRTCGSETEVDASNPSDLRYFSCGRICERFVFRFFIRLLVSYFQKHSLLRSHVWMCSCV